jgi:hypothetical protein
MAITIPVAIRPVRAALPEADVKLADKERRITPKWKRWTEAVSRLAYTTAAAVQDMQTGASCSGITVEAHPGGAVLAASDSGKLFTNEL